MLLMCLLDPVSSTSSNMSIDGISLHSIDRSTLRQRIIAVPQDAVFLPDGASFKANLDPFSVATDDECQAAFEAASIWAVISSRGGLAAEMTNDSLSQGQKQLFSLARAILRRRVRNREWVADIGEAYLPSASVARFQESSDERSSAVVNSTARDGGLLVLDEFSSSVDIETDRTMRGIIQREFEGYTILAVSHRLEMVMEFDRVLVMDTGMIVEQGAPRELVEREGGRLRDLWMVGKSG
jgi:ATP-binding cassette subfamily C (CFTR/MRP) protein 1